MNNIKEGYEHYFEGMKKLTCCICGCDFYDFTGNNPAPIVNDDTSVCCDACNRRIVFKERAKSK